MTLFYRSIGTRTMGEQNFHGCKVALFIGERLLVTLRDDKPDIPFPNMWDFVGGGREGVETPEETLIREVREEVGLHVTATDLIWKKQYNANFMPDAKVFFFVAKLPASAEFDIVFGDEGQAWKLVNQEAFWKIENMVPAYASRLKDWLVSSGSGAAALNTE